MLNNEHQREIVVTGLREYLQKPVVRTNVTSDIPDDSYLGYNIITLASENNGTYAEWEEDNKARKPVLQTWSFKSHSSDYAEAVEIANSARNWLDYVGKEYLNDNDVIVQSVGNVTDRSNLLSIEYDYSYGFDCVFWMYDEIDLPDKETVESIENAEVKFEE